MINMLEIHIPVCSKIYGEEKKEYEEMEIYSNEHSTEVDVIFYCKRLLYSIKFIAAEFAISKEKVCQILSKYKENIKKIWTMNKRKRKGLRHAVEQKHLLAIKNDWVSTIYKPIKIKDIKEYLWPLAKREKAPHNSTISRVLSNELNMSYKVLQKKNPVTRYSSNIRLFHESIAFQTLLRVKGFELIYVDEFHYSSLK